MEVVTNMRFNTQLGASLGQLLSQAVTNQGFNNGQLDGMKIQNLQADNEYKLANADKLRTETEAKQRENYLASDAGLAETLLQGIGANSNMGKRDFNAMMTGGTVSRPIGPPTEQQYMDGNNAMPAPSYQQKLPTALHDFAALKKMLVLGDKDYTHMSKAVQNEQRNALTQDLATMTPDQIAQTGLRVSALEGNPNPLEMVKAAITYGLANGNNGIDRQNALLLSQGKTRFDNMGGQGTFDLLNGTSKLNELGQSGVRLNDARSVEAKAGASENTAQAGLANTRAENIKAGKGDGSNQSKRDMAQIRDDVRAEYNLVYPINAMTGKRNSDVDFDTFEKKWLQKYNINPTEYYRENNSPKAGNPQYDEYVSAFNKVKNSKSLNPQERDRRLKALTDKAKELGLVQ